MRKPINQGLGFIENLNKPALAIVCWVIPVATDAIVDRKVECIIVTAVAGSVAIAVELGGIGNRRAVVVAGIVGVENKIVAEQPVLVLYLQELE